MIIPDVVKKAVPKTPEDNQYYRHAEDAYQILSKVYSGDIDYCSDFVAMAANTLERYYKAVLSEQKDIKPQSSLSYLMEHSHNIKDLVNHIEGDGTTKVFNCHTRQDYYNRDCFLKELQRFYTTSRYTVQVPFSDFKDIFDVLTTQRETVIHLLGLDEKEKNIEDYEREDDDYGLD